MNIRLVLAFVLLSLSTAGGTTSYVKVCSVAGPGYFYLPGTDRCMNPSTGMIAIETVSGFKHVESDLARRISNLEMQFNAFEEVVDLYYPE